MKIEWKKKKGGVVMKYERLTRGARDIFFFFFLFCFIFVGFFSLLLLFFFSSPAPFFCLRLCVSVVFVVARNYGPNWWWRLMADTTERVFFIIICWLFLLFFLGGLLRSLVGRRIGLGNKTRRKRFGSCFFFGFFFGLLVGFVWQSTGLMCRFKWKKNQSSGGRAQFWFENQNSGGKKWFRVPFL